MVQRGDQGGFASGLFRGTAAFYDRFRLPYPEPMLADLLARTGAGPRGRLLDLGCGTGRLSFPLRDRFSEVWAVDQEPDMVAAVRAKAAALGAERVRPVVASAETLAAPAESFDLIVIGNAFHRFDRDAAARRTFGWLRPGGHLALCWSTPPWAGDADWQRALAALLDAWRVRRGAEQRIPVGWAEARERRPDVEVLTEAGFGSVGRLAFDVPHQWTLPELAGHIRSTSFLPPSVLDDEAAAFDAALETTLAAFAPDGNFAETVHFAYDLARKPG